MKIYDIKTGSDMADLEVFLLFGFCPYEKEVIKKHK